MTKRNIKKALVFCYFMHLLFMPYIYIKAGSMWALILFEIATWFVLFKVYFLSLYMYRRNGQLKD
jgi:hypothetical protein